MCRELEDHLAMVFHRFLSGEATRSRKLKILVNGNEVVPWDPFCRSEPRTRKLESIYLNIITEDIAGEIRIDPYILPHQDDFSSPEAFRKAAGPAGWNQQQGFYIHRASRLIQSGGWCYLRKADEHTKLARVAISFLPVLDEAFKINVAKMRVQLPAAVRDDVDAAIGPVVKLAREVYDRKPSKASVPLTKKDGAPAPGALQPSPGVVKEAPPATGYGSDLTRAGSGLMTLEQFARLASELASDNERPVVEKVIARMKRKLT
jgi:hypothetical protein